MLLSGIAYKLGYQLGKTYAQAKTTLKAIWQCWCNPPHSDSLVMELLGY